MFTEPTIITSDDLSARSYVKFYYNGVRYREYSGKRIGKPIHPNRATTIQERDKALRKLKLELLTALENDLFLKEPVFNPPVKTVDKDPSTVELLTLAIKRKQATNLTHK
jgi:hypothetical protein